MPIKRTKIWHAIRPYLPSPKFLKCGTLAPTGLSGTACLCAAFLFTKGGNKRYRWIWWSPPELMFQLEKINQINIAQAYTWDLRFAACIFLFFCQFTLYKTFPPYRCQLQVAWQQGRAVWYPLTHTHTHTPHPLSTLQHNSREKHRIWEVIRRRKTWQLPRS